MNEAGLVDSKKGDVMYTTQRAHRLAVTIGLAFYTAFSATPLPAETKPAATGVYNVTTFGAKGDGTTLNTTVLQAAIDACAAAGGGTVLIPRGTFLSGTLYMKDNVVLHLDHAATLLGSGALSDYPINVCKYPSRSDAYTLRALIWGEGLQNIGITGTGVIDGQGHLFKGNVATAEEIAAVKPLLEPEGRFIPEPRYMNRPYVIRFISCRNVRVEGVAMRASPMWMQHYLDCDFVTIRGVSVFNHGCANNDMIDIDGCRNVIVSDCFGDTDDDALTLKSTGSRPTEHVVVSNCVLSSHCNAIKAGTESAGGFNDITISNSVIRRSSVTDEYHGRVEGLAGIALEIVDGGSMRRVAISNITVEGTVAPIFIRLGNRGRAARPSAHPLDPLPPVGTIRDISISNIVATGASNTGCAIAGLPDHPIENLSLSNIRISFAGGGTERPWADVPENPEKYPEITMFDALPAYGFYIRHATGLRMSGIDLQFEAMDGRPAIVADDVRDAIIDGVNAEVHPESHASMLLANSQGILIRDTVAGASQGFLKLEGSCQDIALMNNDLRKAEVAIIPQENDVATQGNLTGKAR
ncbi:MAG: exo-poly-alpha-D-galacturonosidase [Candidatus Hydrogenedentota bacterium]